MPGKELKTYDIDKVEIFRAGTWNGEKYTESDLDEMVRAHDEIGNELKPYLKLGHDADQKILQKSGMPAAGWFTKVWREGASLYGKLQSVPEKIKKLIDLKQYGRLSAEIYWNLAHPNGKKYPRALKAVALLGADTPELGSLDDFINLYETENINAEVKSYHTLKGYVALEDTMDNDNKVVELEGQVKEFSKQIEERDKKLAEYEAQFARIEQEKKEIEVKSFMEAQVKEGKITPAQVEMFTKLILGQTTEDKGDVKTYASRFDVVKNIIACGPAPKMGEKLESGQTSTKTYSNDRNTEPEFLDDVIDKKVNEHMKKTGEKDYKKAFEAVTAEMAEDKEAK